MALGLEHLPNFRQVTPDLATSGQPEASDIARIARQGYRTLINLALLTSDRALPDERDLAEAQGLDYLHFPLNWETPEEETARAFLSAMAERRDARVYVHCVMNYRVSALVHSYRVAVLGDDPWQARQDLLSVWTPNETWRRLAASVARTALGPVRLETERLFLREIQVSDAEAMQRYAGELENVHYMDWGPNTIEQTRGFCELQLMAQQDSDRRAFELAICEKTTATLIGGAGLRVNPEKRQGDIGYILHRDYWGRGLCTEAAGVLLRLGFGVLGLHRIFAFAHPENLASRRVMEKLGMRTEGTLRQNVHIRGEFQDRIIAAMLEDEYWARTQQALEQTP